MAMIQKLQYLSNKKGKKQEPVSKGECFGFTQNGEKYFQLDTYGRENRQNPNQKSQQIQLDKQSATYLVNILIEFFDLEIDLKVK
ncbi:hypothetical protein [Helicobacter sp. T3_23-1056]